MFRVALIITFFFPVFLIGQSQADFTKTDEMARKAPKSVSASVDKLAAYLTKNADSDIQKVRAFYVWLTENIAYDTKLFFDKTIPLKSRLKKQQVENVLKYKRGVCDGYTHLFQALCVTAGIPTEKVNGFTKTHRERVARVSHSWNTVRIDGKWYLIDNTWGAGYVDGEKKRYHRRFSEKYFLTDPEIFVLDHYPNDPLYQLSDNPVRWEVFQKAETDIKAFMNGESQADFVHFQDSLNYFHSLEKDEKMQNSFTRIFSFDPQNSHARYLACNYYFDEAVKDFDAYRIEAQSVADNIRSLEKKHLLSWTSHLESSKKKLNTAKTYIETIQPRDKLYRNAVSAKKNIKSALVNVRQAEDQLRQFEDYLEKNGN
ncbi:MAG: hypothetical protein GY705_10875 [Bacteroidetes bacterium]|nr:hypothetical protein [Bacteroidota bacterium]